jgi:hypothetical protein
MSARIAAASSSFLWWGRSDDVRVEKSAPSGGQIRNRRARSAVGATMPNLPGLLGRPLLTVVVLLLAGCNSGTATPSGSPSPVSPPGASAPPSSAPTQSSSPPVGAIDHATGAKDIVLRLEMGGGFAPMELMASQAPIFTLYGNGVVIFQPKVVNAPEPDRSGAIHLPAWRAARLDERQIEDLLGFAIGRGGLGLARDAYIEGGVADVPNTIFTLKAGGIDKTVVVNALAEGGAEGPDAAARAAFFTLAERLRDFDQGGSISTDPYQPEAFRGVLTNRDPDPLIAPLAWPWPSIKPTDFKETANDGTGGIVLPHRTLSASEGSALGIQDLAGGVQNLVLTGPDGKIYSLTIRPLLPEEAQ